MADMQDYRPSQAFIDYAHTGPLDTVLGRVLSSTATHLGALHTHIQLLAMQYPAYPESYDEECQRMTYYVNNLFALYRVIVAEIVIPRLSALDPSSDEDEP